MPAYSSALPLHQVFYISRSLAVPEELENILATARHLNSQRGVTGALLFTGGHFAQMLEGPADALGTTMAAIAADRRHEAVRRLLDEGLAKRRFAEWTMAFAEAPGADDLLQHLLSAPHVPQERVDRLVELMFASTQA